MSDGKVVIDSTLDDDGLKRGIKKLKARLGKLADKFDDVGEAAGKITLASSIIPAVVALTGAVGGLASSFAAAGGALGAFGLAAMGQISRLKNATDETMTATQKAFKNNLKEMKASWNKFLDATEQPVFQVFNDGLEVAKSLLHEIVPIVKPAADSLSYLLDRFNEFSKTEEFRSFIDFFAGRGSDAIKNWGLIAGNVFVGFMELMKAFGPLAESMENGILNVSKKFADWSKTLEGSKGFQAFIDYVKTNGKLVMGILGDLFQILGAVAKILAPLGEAALQVADNITGLVTALLKGEPIGKFVDGLKESIPNLINVGMKIVTSLIKGLAQALPQIIQAGAEIAGSVLKAIIKNIPTILKAGFQLLQAFIDGVMKNAPKIIVMATQLLMQFSQTIINMLPQIIQMGLKLLNSLIDGITKNLPLIIQAIILLVTSILTALTNHLPQIINAGIKLLNALIDGIIQSLPMIIDATVKLITALLDALIENLPKIIDAGIKLLLALIDGIQRMLPKLIDAAIKLLFKLVDVLIDHLDEIIAAGIEIIGALVKGLIKALPDIWDMIRTDLIPQLIKELNKIDLWEIGKNIIKGLIDGFTSLNIPTPHFSVSGGLDLNPVGGFHLPDFDVNWYKSGGVFPANSPRLVGMGDASVQEAALPLTSKVLGTIGAKIAETMPQMASGGQTIVLDDVQAKLIIDGYEAGGIIDFVNDRQEKIQIRHLRARGI